ncbi:MAG: ABC transporter permease [Planctomycetota bacterium]
MIRTALVIAAKDLRLLMRDKAAFFFTFVFPMVYGIMFGFMFSGGGGSVSVNVLAFDEDGTEASAAFIEALDAREQIRITRLEDPLQGPEMVRRGDASVFLLVPEGFGEALDAPIIGGSLRLGGSIDPTASMTLGLVQGLTAQTLFELLGERFAEPELARGMVQRSQETLATADTDPATKFLLGAVFSNIEQLINNAEADAQGDGGDTTTEDEDGGSPLANLFELDLQEVTVHGDRPANAFEITMPQAGAWALMGCLFGFATSLVQERSKGTMPRLLASPITPKAVLTGKATGCFVSAVLVQVFLLVVGWLFLDVRVPSILTAAMAVSAAAAGFVGIMMVLAALGRSEAGTEGMGRAVMLILALSGGAAVPMDFLNIEWLQKVSYISPFRWSILATEGALWRAYSPAEMLLPCGVLIAIGIVGFVIGAKLFEFQGAGDR